MAGFVALTDNGSACWAQPHDGAIVTTIGFRGFPTASDNVKHHAYEIVDRNRFEERSGHRNRTAPTGASDNHNRQFPRAFVRLQRRVYRKSVHDRQIQIEQDGVGTRPFNGLQRNSDAHVVATLTFGKQVFPARTAFCLDR